MHAHARRYFAMTGIGQPSTTTQGERDFMIQMIFTLFAFVLFVVFYTNSGLFYGISRNPFGSLGFSLYTSSQGSSSHGQWLHALPIACVYVPRSHW